MTSPAQAPAATARTPKALEVVPIAAPPAAARRRRDARFAEPGGKRDRYALPNELRSASPVGYRTRVPLTRDEASEAMELLSLTRPRSFVSGPAITEGELFEEASLGILSARQSTNYRGHRQRSFGPADSAELAPLLAALEGLEGPVLDGAQATHVVLTRPYRTPFTMLLTLVGHGRWTSGLTVARRLWNKRLHGRPDIPTIGYLQDLHLGILADAMERAAVIASAGHRKAMVFMAPFAGANAEERPAALRHLERRVGLTAADRLAGWRIGLVAQVGAVPADDRVPIRRATCRKVGANLMAFRSERVQPGVQVDPRAPEVYQKRQPMDVPEALVTQAGRASYNAFAHWASHGREGAKRLLLMERIDVLAPHGKRRLRELRRMLGWVTDQVVRDLPWWADLPTGRAFSRNANKGRKAFALAGQRIYVVGLSPDELSEAGLHWDVAVRATGAAAARAALYAELMGVVDLPEDCDLLAGICLMAGPVNQNDIGKTFYGQPDLLDDSFGARRPSSLLVWTLKAKTVADPIGNEQQLLDEERKGALVDLRPGPHEVVGIVGAGDAPPGRPMRARDGRVNTERAFGDVGNFVTDPEGRGIPGNRGAAWPRAWADAAVWPR